MTLTEFLLFRIAEDEATAAGEMLAEMGVTIEMRDKTASMLGYLGPTHVLAECEAKRQVIEHGLRTDALMAQWDGPLDPKYVGYHNAITDALRAIAQPYSDHPDFQGEWRP